MVIFYNLKTKEIIRTEDNTMIPVLPADKTFEEKKVFYKEKGEGFIALPYELGSYIYDYILKFNGNDFIGLQPKNI